MLVESGFNPAADLAQGRARPDAADAGRSPPSTACATSTTPRQNIAAGTRQLSHLLSYYGGDLVKVAGGVQRGRGGGGPVRRRAALRRDAALRPQGPGRVLRQVDARRRLRKAVRARRIRGIPASQGTPVQWMRDARTNRVTLTTPRAGPRRAASASTGGIVSPVAGDPSPVDQGVFLLHLNRARRERARGAASRTPGASSSRRATLRPHDEDVLNLVSLLEFKRGHYNEAASAARVAARGEPVVRGPPLEPRPDPLQGGAARRGGEGAARGDRARARATCAATSISDCSTRCGASSASRSSTCAWRGRERRVAEIEDALRRAGAGRRGPDRVALRHGALAARRPPSDARAGREAHGVRAAPFPRRSSSGVPTADRRRAGRRRGAAALQDPPRGRPRGRVARHRLRAQGLRGLVQRQDQVRARAGVCRGTSLERILRATGLGTPARQRPGPARLPPGPERARRSTSRAAACWRSITA